MSGQTNKPLPGEAPAPGRPDRRHVPLQITWRILASLASRSIVNMVASVMPMYGMNSNTGRARGAVGARGGAGRTSPWPAPPARGPRGSQGGLKGRS